MTESTTIGDYKVEYDHMGKPTFTDAKGNIVHHTDLKGNELALANNHFKLVSGNTQDSKTNPNLSKDRLAENTTIQKDGQAKDATPQEMAKINELIASAEKSPEKISKLRETLNNLGTKAKKAIKTPIATIEKAIKDKQSTH